MAKYLQNVNEMDLASVRYLCRDLEMQKPVPGLLRDSDQGNINSCLKGHVEFQEVSRVPRITQSREIDMGAIPNLATIILCMCIILCTRIDAASLDFNVLPSELGSEATG